MSPWRSTRNFIAIFMDSFLYLRGMTARCADCLFRQDDLDCTHEYDLRRDLTTLRGWFFFFSAMFGHPKKK